MRMALDEARLAFDEGEVPVGAVVVRNGEVIASAHNLTERLGDASAHAELLALKKAAAALSSRRLTDCELYVTMEPCPMCMGAALNFRVGAVCFGAYDREAGCAFSRCSLGNGAVNLTVPCVGGMLEDECAALLTAFFKTRRGDRPDSGENTRGADMR